MKQHVPNRCASKNTTRSKISKFSIKALIIIENIHLEIVIKIFISLFIMCLMLTFDNNYLLNVFQIKLVPLYIYVSRDTCVLNNFERFKVTINILDVYGIF